MVDQNVISAVERGSITNMRSALKGCINKDLNFKRGLYDEAITYMCNNGISINDIYDAHDQEAFNVNQSEWNIEYYNAVMADLLFNFSKERINHLKQVGQCVFPVPSSSVSSINNSMQTGDTLKKYLPILVLGGILLVLILVLLLKENR